MQNSKAAFMCAYQKVIISIALKVKRGNAYNAVCQVRNIAPVAVNRISVSTLKKAYASVFCDCRDILYVVIMSVYGEVEWGPIAASYLGIALIGATFTSLGTFTSAISRNQIIAAALCFMLGMVFFVAGILEYVLNDANTQIIFKYVNFWNHIDDFSRGIVDTRAVIYNLSVTVTALFLTVRVLAWRHRS